MIKTVIIFILLLLPFSISGKNAYFLELRASYHTEFLRIVIESTEPLIARGVVNQKGRDIIAKFPYANFTVRKEKMPIPFKTDKDTIIFSPGYFSRFNVFTLKYPSRLVIDVYTKKQEKGIYRSIDAIREKLRKSTKPPSKYIKPEKTYKAHAIRTVVIDPGHGGYESGIVTDKLIEKNVVLDISKRLNALINRDTARGLLTRKSDQSMTLSERVKFSNNKKADIFISFHIGDHNNIILYTPVITDPVPYGIKKFLLNKGQEDFVTRSEELAKAIQETIKEEFDNDMVSIKPLPYSILSRVEAAALLIELPSFEDANYVSELKTEFANMIFKGIYLYEESTTY